MRHQQEEIARELSQKQVKVRSLALEVESLHQTDYFSKLYKAQQKKLDTAQKELQSLHARHTELSETRLATESYLVRIQRGDWGDPQAHIKHKHAPEPPVGKQNRLLELWAAVSSGLLMLIFVVLVIVFPAYWLT